jgi:hypothetical protein
MIKEGWILLYGVGLVPHEVERLISLLEENQTLFIYESIKSLFFHNPKFNNETISQKILI